MAIEGNLEWKCSQTNLSLPIRNNVTFTQYITHMIIPTHTDSCTHSQTDTHALFLQDPADAAETVELVSLVNKQ